MVDWEICKTISKDEWDGLLLKSGDCNIFQSYGWGELKQKSGWQPIRMLARNGNGNVIAMLQIMTKTFPAGFATGWAPGGPVFHFPQSTKEDLPDILKLLTHNFKGVAKRTHLRLNSHVANEATLSYYFKNNFVRPIFRINSGYSIFIDLSRPLDELKQKMTAKHRYYVKKALAQNVTWRFGNEQDIISDFFHIHNKMIKSKGLETINTSLDELNNLSQSLENNLTFLLLYSEGNPISGCLFLTFGKTAIYMMAAADEEGRKLGVSYAMIPILLEYLKAKGIYHFDFGGIDPRNKSAEGVNHFKKGFGGTLVEYLGEWEWSSSDWFRYGMNFAIAKRGGHI